MPAALLALSLPLPLFAAASARARETVVEIHEPVVALRPMALPESPAVFRLLYQSSRRKLWVIEI